MDRVISTDLPPSLQIKLDELRKAIRKRSTLVVAYSGGVDSSLLAKVAYDELGDKALAVMAHSESVGEREREDARQGAERIGIRFRIATYSAIENPSYSQNLPSRCYHCRQDLFKNIQDVAAKEGILTIADGHNISDIDDYRPGTQAADEAGIWHPFCEVGITKEEVRALADFLDVPAHDRPSSPCLSSRIAYNESITNEKLQMVERAEGFLHEMGFKQVRVRLHQGVARIEVEAGDIPKVLKNELFQEIAKRLREIGFMYVTLDLEGFKSGSMNRVLGIQGR